MFSIDDNDQLFKVHSFRLERSERVIWIDVYEHLNSTSDTKFYALPIEKPLEFNKPKVQYIKNGSTLEYALNTCLDSISGLECADLFEKDLKRKAQ